MAAVAAAHNLDGSDFLQIDAGADAPAAEHALVEVADRGVAGEIDFVGGLLGVPEAEEVHPVLLGEALQLAVVVAAANDADESFVAAGMSLTTLGCFIFVPLLMLLMDAVGLV